MGLLPLEFSDCLLDSPYYRENLKAHEKQLEQTSISIKALISGITEVLDSAKLLIKAKKTLADTLENCQFDCLGTTLTDDEILIASSLKQFARFLSAMEDEMNGILLQANEKFITPLLNFRKEQIGSVKNTKKAFDKATAKLCQAQDKYVAMSGKKEESLAEAAEIVRHEQKNLNSCSLEYVYLMHVVQERKKFEFVEAILSFTQSWVNYYTRGSQVAKDQEDYMNDLKDRVKKTRDNFSTTSEKYEGLKEKMLSSPHDPGLLNRMYTRQGYLFVQGKKNLKLGSVWTKYFCQYQAKTKTLTMIAYSQLSGKIASGESLRVTNCVCLDDTNDKFRFSVSGEDLTEAGLGMVTHNIQALSEFERKHWVEALGGTWPAVNTLQRIRADSVEDNLNSCAFTFLKDCLSELESRGLVDQGLYRVGGVVSKVKKLLNQALDPAPGEECPDMSDPKLWESKTLASAVKLYFRDLSKPLMTYQLYSNFLEAVKKEEESSRLNEIYLVLQKLPRANREILKVLIRHLSKVSLKSDKNLMTASNLGVVFGPSLLRPREETVATIMDIKFCNEVIAILIDNSERFFPSSESSPEFLHNRRPSMESRSTAEVPSPAVSNKCKRTQSFSSFSQLSTASLPDIKEFHQDTSSPPPSSVGTSTAPTTTTSRQVVDRTRSKSHQHELPSTFSVHHQHPPTLPRKSSKESSFSTTSSSKEGSPAPAPIHLSRAATQDDLMASLEMMNLLAADLPTNSPLKRSYTLNPKRMTRGGGGVNVNKEVTRKPPLPKLSSIGSPITTTLGLPSFEGSTPTSCQSIPGLYTNVISPQPPQRPPPPLYQRQNSAPQIPPSPNSNKLITTKPSRPSDLPNKLISAFEGICASPGQTRRAYRDNNLVIEEYGSKAEPPGLRNNFEGIIPKVSKFEGTMPSDTTKYTNYINLTLNGDHDNGSISSHDHSIYSSNSPRGISEDRLSSPSAFEGNMPTVNEFEGNSPSDYLHSVTSSSPIPLPLVNSNNVSHDSGVIISPSPPTDSGIALMSPLVSHKHFNNNNNVPRSKLEAHNHNEDSVSVLSCSLSEASDASGSKYDNVLSNKGEMIKRINENEEELSDSSNILENLVEDEETSESDADHDLNNKVKDPEVKTKVSMTSDLGRSRKLDNVRQRSRDSGPYENVTETNNDNSDHHDTFDTGLHSLRKMLTSGQTSNV